MERAKAVRITKFKGPSKSVFKYLKEGYQNCFVIRDINVIDIIIYYMTIFSSNIREWGKAIWNPLSSKKFISYPKC